MAKGKKSIQVATQDGSMVYISRRDAKRKQGRDVLYTREDGVLAFVTDEVKAERSGHGISRPKLVHSTRYTVTRKSYHTWRDGAVLPPSIDYLLTKRSVKQIPAWLAGTDSLSRDAQAKKVPSNKPPAGD